MTPTANLLREMTTAEVIASAFRLYRDHLASLVLIALIPHMVLLALNLILADAGLDPAQVLTVLLFATAILNAIVLAAMTNAIGHAALGASPGLVESYRGAFSRSLVGIITAYLMIWGLVTLGFLLLVLPGLVVGGLLLPTVPTIVLERRRSFQALSRAFRMMRPQMAKATAVFSFVILISGVLPLGFHLMIGTGPFSPLLGAILGAVTLPLAYAANVVLYLSERSKEGYTARDLSRELQSAEEPR
jgi:uncharacterized membrane protein YesL